MFNKTVVITGSSRGIGYGLAENFLQLGCAVTVSGKNRESTERAVQLLSSKHDESLMFGLPCNVTLPEQLNALWNETTAHFGRVDIWVNNAGFTGDMGMIWERPFEEIRSVLNTNLLGTIFGSQIAFQNMQLQGHGAIYNMEGFGSNGSKRLGLSLYGTTKYAVHYFTQSLAMEVKHTPVIIGGLQPGMVATDLIRNRYRDRPEDWERAKRIFNILAERVETVTPWLAKQMLTNQKHGVILSYSSKWKLLLKMISSPFVKRRVFEN